MPLIGHLMYLARLALGALVLTLTALIALPHLTTPALATSDGYEEEARVEVFCSLFDDHRAFQRFQAAYQDIKKATGRDPSMADARAAAGLGPRFCVD
jgi:hypothetical protein